MAVPPGKQTENTTTQAQKGGRLLCSFCARRIAVSCDGMTSVSFIVAKLRVDRGDFVGFDHWMHWCQQGGQN